MRCAYCVLRVALYVPRGALGILFLLFATWVRVSNVACHILHFCRFAFRLGCVTFRVVNVALWVLRPACCMLRAVLWLCMCVALRVLIAECVCFMCVCDIFDV